MNTSINTDRAKHLIAIESTLHRVASSVRGIADEGTRINLNDVMYFFAELRHAAVCADEGISKDEVLDRLWSLVNPEAK